MHFSCVERSTKCFIQFVTHFVNELNSATRTFSSRRESPDVLNDVSRYRLTCTTSLLVSELEKVVDHISRSPIDEHFVPDLFTDEELTNLAMTVDREAPIDENAVPWNWGFGFERSLLPDWYMPRPIATGRGKGTKVVVGTLVAGLLIIGAFGLCITSGFLSFA